MKTNLLFVFALVVSLIGSELAGFAEEASLSSKNSKVPVTVLRSTPSGEIEIIPKKSAYTESKKPEVVAQAGPQTIPTKQTKPTPTAQKVQPPEMAAPVLSPAAMTGRKVKVLVLPATIAQDYRKKLNSALIEQWGISDSGFIDTPGYTSLIMDSLNTAHKVDVVSQDELNRVLKESATNKVHYTDIGQAAKIGNRLGADYIVIPEIRTLEINRGATATFQNGPRIAMQCKISTSARIVDGVTKRVVSSDISEVVTNKYILNADKPNTACEVIGDTVSDLLMDQAAREAGGIIDVAYPVRVTEVKDNIVTINRGQDDVENGESFMIFGLGDLVSDTGGKEDLGLAENYLATVEVTEVGKDSSKAKIVDSVAPIPKYAICHRNISVQKHKGQVGGDASVPVR